MKVSFDGAKTPKTLLPCDFCSMRTKALAILLPSVVEWYNLGSSINDFVIFSRLFDPSAPKLSLFCNYAHHQFHQKMTTSILYSP